MSDRPPLWEVMEQGRDAVIAAQHPFAREEQCLAAEIRAVRDWLVPEEEVSIRPPGNAGVTGGVEWAISTDRQRLRALLTAEAERAERGDQSTSENGFDS